MGKILRVNMTKLTTKFEDVPAKYRQLGGRGLTSTITFDEVSPTCHPLGPNNKLTFAPGIVTGAGAPSSGRISVGGKSPLTGGIKESNSGGVAPEKMAKLGLKAIIVEGQPKEKGKFYLLKVDKTGAELLPADEFAGKGLYEAYPMMFQKFGGSVGIMACGVAGEKLMSMAGVCVNDPENRPSRYAGRGGLGAVMGSKGLKAIILDEKGSAPVPIANKKVFSAGRKKLANANDVAYEQIATQPWAVTNDDIIRFLRIVTDPNQTPVYVHCLRGADRTGTMCAIYRMVVQGWTPEQALQEMTQGGFGFYAGWQNLIDEILQIDIQQVKMQAGLNPIHP